MSLPLPPGLTPAEVGFLCENEQVTVIPRQRLDGLELMSGSTQPLIPPFPTPLPLWLALLLKRQQRANIQPPAWLDPAALTQILDLETDEKTSQVFAPPPELPAENAVRDDDEEYLSHHTLELSTPFLANTSTTRAPADSLPFHWLELSHLLLTNAADDFHDPDTVRRLVRDLQEVRMSKLRKGFRVLGPGGGIKMNGIGGMEIAEVHGFVSGVVDGLRKIGRSREEARKEREADERDNGAFGGSSYQDDDDDMQL
ncbi:hypothetical protein AMS68_002500 [Peltaster fructicola]|uniref:DNA replication complex GINS protein PSF2 n=1 Tax=Peltaster fructicola TaxID=286661 RepID=A0A6H0XQK1_9PEZI|nr:hypothetical protein AMS68_002500 [Peltaster fructicola]